MTQSSKAFSLMCVLGSGTAGHKTVAVQFVGSRAPRRPWSDGDVNMASSCSRQRRSNHTCGADKATPFHTSDVMLQRPGRTLRRSLVTRFNTTWFFSSWLLIITDLITIVVKPP